jgi:hypothetical protein
MGFSAAQAIVGAMITPALLIMASGSLIATALVRLARVVDHVRALGSAGGAVSRDDLDRHERRILLAGRAVWILFAAVVCFVLAGFAIPVDHFAGNRLLFLPVGMTTLGMAMIVAGAAVMLVECRLASVQIQREIAGLRRKGSGSF